MKKERDGVAFSWPLDSIFVSFSFFPGSSVGLRLKIFFDHLDSYSIFFVLVFIFIFFKVYQLGARGKGHLGKGIKGKQRQQK